MYFNRKNAAQKNWRMIKKGKHFLFGCSLVFAVGAALVAPSVKADTVETKPEAGSTTGTTKPTTGEENVTYAAPAVEVAPSTPVAPATVEAEEKAEKTATTTENSKEEAVATTDKVEKAKEADSIQAPEVTVVYDPSALTDEEKAKVVAAVKAANPTATDVQVQADGSVVVTFADGSSANLTAAQTIKDGSLVAKPRTNRAARATATRSTATRATEGSENLDYTNKEDVEGYVKISYEVDKANNVIHWTVLDNPGQKGNSASGYVYFTIPKDSVGAPTNWSVVQKDKNGKITDTRNYWKDNDGSYLMGQKGRMDTYTGSEMTKRLTELFKKTKNPAIKGNEAAVAAQTAERSQALYTLTADNNKIRNVMWTITFDTPILDKTKPLDFVAGMQGTGLIGGPTNIMTGFTDNFIEEIKFQAVAVKEKYTAKVGGSFNADPATYVTNKAGTPEFPNNYRGATTFAWKDGQAPTATTPGTYTKTVVVTYPAHYKQAPQEVTVTFEVEGETPKPVTPAKPVVNTDLTGKAGTKTSVEVTADPGTTVELFDKDNNKIGEATADNNGKATITPTVDIPAGNVTAKATKDGQTSVASDPVTATTKAAPVVAPTVEIPYSDKDTKEVYVYGGEENSFDIKFKDDSGKIASATVKQGGNRDFDPVTGEADTINTQYGFKANVINAETPATADAPAVITYRGTPAATDGLTQDRLTAATKGENPAGLVLGWRYATATDTDGALIENKATGGSTATDPGAFRVVLKPQNQKYDIATPTEKVTVADPANVTEAELAKIKEKVQLEYSQNNDDANLADKKGTTADKTNKIQSVTKDDNGNLVVTYTDGSIDKKPLSEFVNVAPTVEIPYSNKDTKEVYVYGGEENSFDIKFKDDSGKIASATVKQGGNKDFGSVAGEADTINTQYGFKANVITTETPATADAPAVITYRGTPAATDGLTQDRLTAATKGENPAGLVLGWRYATATDTDGALIENKATGGSTATDPGAFRVVLKPQNQKYDIATPTEKVTVADPANVTEAELAKIKEKLQLEYSKTNDDANLADKKGTAVADKDAKIQSVTKDADGNLVVTYKDGSQDKKPLSEFVNVAPTVELPYSNQEHKQIYVYTGENTDLTFKASDNTAVKDMYVRGPGKFKNDNTATYGFTTGKIENSAVTHGDGTVSGATATIKMTGVTNLTAPNRWTSFVVANDNDNAPSNTDFNALDVNPNATQTPGYVQFIVKSQTDKYDIATPAPADKVEVANPDNVTDAEFDKIKEKLQLEYNKNNDDANISKDSPVDKNGKIQSVEKEGNNLVVTYKDGSKDTKPLLDFVTKAPAKPSKPVVDTDLTGKAGTKTPVEVTAEPGSTVALYDKDGNKIGEGVADENGKAKITPTVDIPEGNVTAKATKDGQTSDASAPKEATAATPAKPSTPVVDTDLTGKAGTKTPVEVTAEPGTKVELFDKDGNKIGEGVADENGKAKITPTVDIPEGNVTAKATKDGQTSDASAPKEATAATPAKPSTPVVDTDLTGKAGTKTPVEVTAEPGTKVELFDKDGNKIGEGVADENGKAKITPTVDIPEGNVTAKATKDGQTSDASAPKEATAATPAKPSTPVVDTDLTGKAGTKTPVEVTAEPGTKVELFDKDGNKIGEGVADENGKAKITPTVDIPEGNVTAKATKDGQTSDASAPKEATAATPAKPSTPVVDTDLTGKAGTKTPVEVTAEPGTKVELFDKDGNKIGEGVADENGKAKITPTVDIPEGNVTAKATKDGQTSDASAPKEATAATPAKPSTPVVDTDLTGKAGTKTPVEVTAEPGTKVELFDKDGNKIGEGVADENGKAKITPTVDIPEGNVTAKATKDGQTSDASAPKEATAATPTTPTQPEITTDLTGKAGTKTPVEVTAEPGSKVEMYDKDGNKIGEATADENGKATITPTVDIPEGNVTVVATKDGQTPEASDPVPATAKEPETPAKPSKPVVNTDLTGKAGTKTPVEVTAEPGTTVELFDKDGNKIGEGVADENGKAKITPTVDIPEGNVTAKATKDGKTSDASAPKEATVATPTTPTQPEITTDLTGKAGTKTPVEVTAEPGSKVEMYDKDGNKIGEATADENGKATITPTVDIPEGNVTVVATKDGQTPEASDPVPATAKEPEIPAKPSKPVVDTDLTGKAGTKTPVEVTAEPGSTVALYDKDGNKIGEGTADNTGKATITPTVDIPAGPVTVKATKDGQTSDASDPAQATAVDKVVKTPSVTPVANPSSLTDAEKAKVADEVKKSNPTVSKVEVGNDGTTTVTYPDGTTAVIPADKTVKKSDDKVVTDPTVTPVTDPSNLTDAEKAKVAEEVKKANPTVTDVKVGEDGTTTVTYPGGTTAVIPSNKTVKRSVDKELKDPAVTPVTNPSNLTDAEKAKVADEVKKANPTVTDVNVDKDGATTVTYPDGTTAVIPADKTVKKSDDKVVTDPSVTPVTDPSNLTDAEKAKVADEVKKSNPTVTDVKVDKDGTTTVTYPDGTTAVIPADKTVKKSDDKAVKDPSVTPVTDPSNLTDAEKAKVADEVKKSNPTVTDVKVDKDGTTTVTYPDGTTAVIPADKTVKKSEDKGTKDPSVTPVTDPSNLTNAEKAKVADEVKKANPTVTDVKVDKDGTTTVTYPDGTTAVIPADKTVKKSDDKAVKDPSVTPVTDPSSLTDAEKAKVADEVKKANPTVTDVKVDKDGTTTVTYPDGTTAVIPADKTVKKSDDKAVKDPSVTPVTDPSSLTDAEKAKVADEVKKANPTVTDVKVDKDGTTTVTYPDGTTAVIPADKTVKKSDDKAVKDPSVTPVADPSNLTDAEKAKVVDEVKKANPTVTDVKVGNDGTTTVTYPDGTTAVIPADKTVKKSDDKAVKDPSVTPVADPSNLTDAEKAKVADEVKKSNPTVSKVEVGNDGTTTVTYPDGTTAVIPADKTVKKSDDKVVTNPSVTPVTDPSNLTDAEKAKVAEEVKKANPTATDVKVGEDGTATVTYPDGTTASLTPAQTVKEADSNGVKTPAVTPVANPSALTDAEKAKVAEEVKKSNPTATDVKVGEDGTATVTFPDGSKATLTPAQTVKEADKELKDPAVTPVTDPSNLTDAEKAKVAEEVKKANPTVTDVKVGEDGTTTVTYPGGTTAVLPSNKTVKRSVDKELKDPVVIPVVNPSALTDSEKAKVAEEVKKSNPTVTDVKVGEDGTTTVTYSDGTTATLTPEKTVKEADSTGVNSPAVTPVVNPSALTDSEKAKVAEEVKKANPTVTDVKVGEDGTTTVTFPDGTTAVISPDKTVKKSADKVIKDPAVTPVVNPSALTDAEKAKVADEVKKANPTVTDVKVGEDGTATVTYPDGTTAVIPSDKTVKKSDDKVIKIPAVTPVVNPSALTDAEKAKVADEVKKANPTATDVKVGEDGTATVIFPDDSKATLTPAQTVKEADSNGVKTPAVTPVANPSALTDAEKAKVAEEVKKANPTAKDIKVNKDGSVVVTFKDGSTAVIPSDKTVKKSADKAKESDGVKNPSVTAVTDPSNLTDAEKAKVADEVKKANPTAKDIKVNKDGSVVVIFKDGSTAVIPSDKTVKKSADKAKESDGVKNPSITAVTDPSNLTDAEKAKVADEVKKANPTAKDIKVNKDGSVVVTFKDGSTAVIPADKTVKKSLDKAKESDGVKNPSVTPVVNPSNLTDAEKAKVADEVKKANPTAKDIKVNNDGSVVVTFADGSVAVIPAEKAVTTANQDSPAQEPAKKAGAKELPNTGTKQSNASLGLALLAAVTGGLLIAKKREEEE